MAFIPTPNSARLALIGTVQGQSIVNTMWFRRASTYDATALENLVSEVSSWWIDEIVPNFSQDYTFTSVYALDASSETGPTFTFTVPAGEVGQIASPTMALNAALTVTFQTATRGRSGRGRNYLSGLAETWGNGVQWQANLVAPIGAGYVALETYLVGTNSAHVVASHYTNGAPRVTGVTYPVINYRLNLPIYSQKNRTR